MSNLYIQLQEQARQRPDATAIVRWQGAGKTTTTSYRRLAELAAGFAAAFSREAAETGIIPLFLGKSAACIAAMIGAIGAGKALACLNKKLRPPQIEAILRGIRPGLALTDVGGLKTLSDGLASGSPIASTRWALLPEMAMLAPHQKMLERMRECATVDTWDAEQMAGDHAFPEPAEDGSRPGCCLFTSGTTGLPKGVLVSESDLRARAAAEVEWFGIGPEDVLLSILPFSFDVGLNQLLGALAAGCSLVLLDSWLPADILRAVAECKVTGISAVPAIWADMLNARLGFRTDGPHASLRYITVSGGDLGPSQLQMLPQMAPGVGIYKTYGQTEAFRATSLRPAEFAERPQSVGRPFGGVHVYVVRDDQTLCSAGEEGEIVHTGLGVMLGYLDGQDPQRKLRPNPFRGPDDRSEMAIFTGDLGHLDEEGYLFVTGRRDGMLKIAGNRVYPKEVADQLLAVAGVREAEVVGAKRPDGQVRLYAFVSAAAGADGAGIRRTLAGRLPSYMLPESVMLLEAIPRTANGKPDRAALNQLAVRLLEGDSYGAHA